MHYEPHFRADGSGLCQCGCEDCTLPLTRSCICLHCSCEQDSDHGAAPDDAQ